MAGVPIEIGVIVFFTPLSKKKRYSHLIFMLTQPFILSHTKNICSIHAGKPVLTHKVRVVGGACNELYLQLCRFRFLPLSSVFTCY